MRTLLLNLAAAVASVTCTAGIVVFADPANATTGVDIAPTQIVSLDDLNLRSDAGRDTAARRIRRAVDAVCGDRADRALQAAQCRDHASDAAFRALDARVLAAR